MRFGLFGERFDAPEFLLGLFLGLFAYWILRRTRPILEVVFKFLKARFQTLRENLAASTAEPYFQDLLFRIDNRHLANPLFPLRQVIVPPKLLIPQPGFDPRTAQDKDGVYPSVLPALPEWNTLAGIYELPSIEVDELLGTDANVMITGELGSGKTTALAFLAFKSIQTLQHDPRKEIRLPVLVHAADLELPLEPNEEPYEAVITASKKSASQNLALFLPRYLRPHLREGKILLLLDGLDELPQEQIEPIREWVESFLEHSPGHQIIAAGSPRGFDGLVKAGLFPLAISPWDRNDLDTFLGRWANAWQTHVLTQLPESRISAVDPYLVNAWLEAAKPAYTPLEITLRTWSAYVGDIQHFSLDDCMKAYLRRMISPTEQHACQPIAVNWIQTRAAFIDEGSVDRRAPVSDLVQAGILLRRTGNKLRFVTPSVGAYLAAVGMELDKPLSLEVSDSWQPQIHCFRYYAALGDMAPFVDQLRSQMKDPLLRGLMTSAAWLRGAPAGASWRKHILSALAMVLQDGQLAYGLRLRVLAAIIHSGEPSAQALFMKLLHSSDIQSRKLGALGLGGLQEAEAVNTLQDCLRTETDEKVRFAVFIALSALRSSEALIVLGKVLLEGENTDQLHAALALAADTGEGLPMLMDASKMEQVRIRRAAVYGLGQLRNNEARAQLRKLQAEDDQAIVRNAATEVLEDQGKLIHHVHLSTGDVVNLPWLLEFAAQQGVGVTPGKGAFEMLRKAVLHGTELQKKAALHALGYHGDREFVLDVTGSLSAEKERIKNAAFEALYQLEAAGSPVLSPKQSVSADVSN